MDDQFTLKALLVAFSAFLGYVVREYQNRVEPFYRILGVSGEVTNVQFECEIPQETREWLRDSKVFNAIQERDKLSNLNNARKDIARAKSNKEEIEDTVSEIIKRIRLDDCTYTDNLSALLSNHYFYLILRKNLYSKDLSYSRKPIEIDEDERMNFSRNKDDDGEVIIDFPNRRVRFGSDFDKYEYIYKLMEPFILAVVNYDKELLKQVLEDFLELFSKSFVEIDLHDRNLEQEIDACSQWAFHMFIANNSSKPFIIGKSGLLMVKDRNTRARFKEEVYLALINLQRTGKAEGIWDLPSDHVLKSGESCHLLLLTKDIQKDMSDGLALRNTFTNDSGEAVLTIPLHRIGLTKKTKLTTRPFPFNNKAEIAIW